MKRAITNDPAGRTAAQPPATPGPLAAQRSPASPRSLAALSLAALLSLTSEALAAPPGTLGVHGVLRAAGGAVAADGNDIATFALYDQASGGAPVWKEGVDPERLHADTGDRGAPRAELGRAEPAGVRSRPRGLDGAR